MSLIAPLSKKRKGAHLVPPFEAEFETGSWVPIVAAGGDAFGTGGTTSAQYTKIGNQVTIQAYIDISSTAGVTSGSITITLPPFAARTSTPTFQNMPLIYASMTLTAGRQMGARIGAAATVITLIEYSSDGTAAGFGTVAFGAISTSTFFYIGGTYLTNDEA